jgi:putative ABC transport system permease protein
MTGSYFKMASRTLLANRGTTIINILGLVIGISSALVIASVIRFEQSFDSFHTKRDDIYRVVRISGNDNLEYRSGVPYAVGDAIKDEVPGVDVLQMDYFGGSTVDVVARDGKTEKKFVESDGLAAVEPEFFDMFDFNAKPLRWISGSPQSLTEPNNIVITKDIAQKYFGNDDPIGQTLRFQKSVDVKVSGVIENFPNNTDFPFKFILSYSTLKTIFGEQKMSDWSSVNDSHQVFIYAPGKSKAELEQQFDVVHAAHVDKDMSSFRHFRLQEFAEVHYDPRFGNFSGRTITHETILALQIIVFFLLLAGCINYINLSTAQSTLRSKEIGLRKVLGSQQRHLMLQLLAETFVVVGLASVVALILVTALMPSIKNLLNLQIGYDLTDPFILISLAVVIAFVTLCSGLYPAFIISKFNPVAALRSKFSNEKVGGINLRKVLVVVQFTITQILAVGTFIVISQMNFFRNVDMGFNRTAVIVNITLPDNYQKYLRPTMNELQRLPFVSAVSSSFTLPSGRDRNRSSRPIGPVSASSVQDYENFEYFSIDENYLDLYEIKLTAGRNLDEADTVRKDISNNVLINESLMKNLGIASPEEALGTEWKFGGGQKVTVVGVVNDFYSNSLKEGVDNIVMVYQPTSYNWLSVRLDLNAGQSMSDAIRDIEKTWSANFPEDLFQYKFFDDNISAFYAQEDKYSKLFQIFSMIFVGIGCLGLYGLITFIANKKGKEIAIRKTLGASIANIIVMFSKEYVVLIGISFAIAVPVVWYGVTEWLASFQNHIELQWWMFASPGLIVMILALSVVSSKSFNAARVNPVDKLKYE